MHNSAAAAKQASHQKPADDCARVAVLLAVQAVLVMQLHDLNMLSLVQASFGTCLEQYECRRMCCKSHVASAGHHRTPSHESPPPHEQVM
jgi:hypothetical protein